MKPEGEKERKKGSILFPRDSYVHTYVYTAVKDIGSYSGGWKRRRREGGGTHPPISYAWAQSTRLLGGEERKINMIFSERCNC